MADGSNPLGDTIGSVLQLMQGVLESGPARLLTGTGTTLTRIGQFFGMDPKYSSMLDMVNAAQEYAANKITKEQLAERGVKDFANWAITAKLEDMGWPAPLASAVASLGSQLAGALAKNLGITNLLGNLEGGAENIAGNVLKALGVTTSPDNSVTHPFTVGPIPPGRGGPNPQT